MLVCTMYGPDLNIVRRYKCCEEEDTCLYVRCMYLIGTTCVDISGVRRRIHACMYDVCT
jgi:hypothetical protein